jgi:hypothetical protein
LGLSASAIKPIKRNKKLISMPFTGRKTLGDSIFASGKILGITKISSSPDRQLRRKAAS